MKKSYLLLHFAVILAGFTGVFGKLISLNEGLLTWYRVSFSAVILFLILKLFRIADRTTSKEKFGIAKIGLLITIHWVFFYASIKYSNISIGVICYCLTSFFTAVFKPFIDKSQFKFSELLLSALTLLGISLIFHFDTSYQSAIMLGVISSAFAALYTIYNERLVKIYDSKIINYYQMMGGTISLGILLPVYLYYFPVENLIPNLKDTFYLILLSLFCTVGLYVSFSEILKKIPAFTVNLSFNLEPIYAIILAFMFFDESKEINISFYIGLFFAMISVILQSIISLRKSK
ncbi:EamA domain-containing membrane protein RarD [Flavobacterium sp. CF108]|uniref:DMT family transporter n=1 Tax=unclassified Flavobacterium TaxID=196869 RepID=UPI0008BDABA4|nr:MULTISPECIES: DMT family transporter [unclassified Flavobacterium]SEO21077.1 EamA domain-containing membrane protein RarD [Flavobacterium sp. fv08]SHG51985.1 EamA domain-containing membrane protein RarD [Flavobacterium sp. CF108]